MSLTLKAQINDSQEELYIWKQGGTTNVNGVIRENSKTKERPGYVILPDGQKIKGIICLKKVNSILDNITIKNETLGKKAYKAAEVTHYGLTPTIADVGELATSIFDDDGKLFHKGWLINSDGNRLDGYVAFVQSKKIRQSDAVLYTDAYYANTIDDPITYIPTTRIKSVVQIMNRKEKEYVNYEEGFIELAKVGSLKSEEQYQFYFDGKISFPGRIELTGKIAQLVDDSTNLTFSIKFKGDLDKEAIYGTEDVVYFEQKIGSEKHSFIPSKNGFVKLIYNGNNYAYYKNPKPTTINQSATKSATLSALILGALASDAVINSMRTSEENKSMAKQNISNSSISDIKSQETHPQFAYDKKNSKKETNNDSKQVLASNISAASGEFVLNTTIYFAEYCLVNKSTGETFILPENDFEKTIEPFLIDCETYLSLSKLEQSKCKSMDNIVSTLKILDRCFKIK